MLRNLLPRKRFHELLRGDRLCGVGQSCGAGKCADDLLRCEFLPQKAEVEVLIALGQTASVMVAQQRDMNEVRRCEAAQLFLLAVGIAMIGFGLWRGEADTVLSKAIRLCMECVGIG